MSLLIPVSASATSLTSDEIDSLYNSNFNAKAYNYVSVHDPSVVVGYKSGSTITGEYTAGATKVYYIFGSHLAFAYSTDLENWTTFTNNLNTNYATIFAKPATWSAKGSTSYSVSGNMWAPDVVWNKSMKKWCMYMSINGDNWYSSIVMLTASSLDGDWTYVGPVVYSGFKNATEAALTDFYKVATSSEDLTRYTYARNGNRTYGLNAIDPCVFYDESGNLWMSYGSWFGGIYMLRLDATTGLRDYSYTYTTTDGTAANATSDIYQGTKIAGGNGVSGEGSYIQYINGKYYLFLSYGGLTSIGGYNMRVFASDSPTGPYVDMQSKDARYSSTNITVGTINGNTGLRLMSYYKWSWMSYGYVAQGHNSAIVDTDGKSFLVYHTRFNDGTEGHQVRVHQLFKTKNGYITAAPFQYAGETLGTEPYATSDIVGHYGIIYHGNGTDFANRACATEKDIALNADGTVTGDYEGTWSQDADGPYINIIINDMITFKGVLLKQKLEGLNYATLCFTAVGNDISMWGYKKGEEGQMFSDEVTVAYNAKNASNNIPGKYYTGENLSTPTDGSYGGKYTWNLDTSNSSSSAVLSMGVTCGDYSYTKTSNVEVQSTKMTDVIPVKQNAILETYPCSPVFNLDTPNTNISAKTGLSLSFYMNTGIASDWDAIAHSTDSRYTMYLSVLRYNSNDTYEAKATLSSAAIAAGYTTGTAYTIFYNKTCMVTVSYNTDGSISYYKDGVLMLTYPATTTPSYGSSVTTANIASAVINYYLNGQLAFDWSVGHVIVGYAVDYASTLGISETAASGIDTNADVDVYSLSGVRIAHGNMSSISIPSGIYIIRQGKQAKTIIVK